MTVASQLFGIPILLLCLVLLPGTPQPLDFAWSAAAGVAGFLGIVLLYESLSTLYLMTLSRREAAETCDAWEREDPKAEPVNHKSGRIIVI